MNTDEANKKLINVVGADQQINTILIKKKSVFNSAPDWQMKINLGSQVKFPVQITQVKLRQDVIIYSVKNHAFHHVRINRLLGRVHVRII